MTTDGSADTVAPVAVAPTALPYLVRERIFLYLGVLIVLLAFGSPSGGLIDIPISFLLKNKLHLQAHELADFRLVSGIPLYLSCVFGFVRDTWNPFGMRDRGFMMLFGAITAGLYVLFAFTPITYVNAPCCGPAVDDFVPFRRKRSERPDLDARPAACDVRSDQRGVEHFRVAPDRRGSPHRRQLSATCSKAGTPIRPPASYFSSALRSWPRWPFTPHGSPKACSTTSAPSRGPPRNR